MKKEEYIRRHGEAAYEKMLQQTRNWDRNHPEEIKTSKQKWQKNHREERNVKSKEWRAANPNKVKANLEACNAETNRKGGKYYERHRQYKMNGIPHKKELVRNKHRNHYSPYKRIIAPESQLHHEWIPETADYRGVALVEADQHMHGFVDVIQILEGEITLLTEAEMREV